MPTPTYRTPVRVARGTYSSLNTSIADLLEGEICYATDRNKYYAVEGGVLTEQPYITANVGAIVNADISTDAGIDIGKLAVGSAYQVLTTNPAGTDVVWSDELELSGGLYVSQDALFDSDVYVSGKIYLEGATGDANNLKLDCVDPTSDRTITFPNATGTVALTGDLSSYAPLASPTFTGTVTIPAGASISGYAALASAQSFTAAQRGTINALGAVSAGSTTLDFATANNFSLSLPAGGTVTLATPSNITAGQSGCIVITQNASTAAQVAYSTAWNWKGGAPQMSTTLSSVNVIAYFVESISRITAQLLDNTVN